jgi:tRNA dimethylallyltransferase
VKVRVDLTRTMKTNKPLPFKEKKFLIIILGPTASGKTSLAIVIAKTLQAEIFSADSRQFFREMNIGTAKPTKTELDQVTHHFINSLSVHDEYNVGMFERDALRVLETQYKTKNFAVMAGGSGLYISAVCNGFDDVPEADKEVREQLTNLYKKEGIVKLQEMLKALDPDHYQKVIITRKWT